MKLKNTLYLIIVAGLLFGFIYFFERHTKSTFEAREQAGRIVEVDRDKVTAVTIKNSETKIDLQKRDNQWFIDQPVKDRADSSVIAQLFTTLEDLKQTATIPGDSKDQLKEYGLADPTMKIVITVDKEKPVEIDLGKDAAVEGKVYAQVAGSSAVEVISNDLKNQISKKTDDFRDRKLADLTSQQVSKMDIKSSAGDLELDKKNNHWSIARPLQARADDSRINDLFSQAATAHVDQFISDQNIANYGLAEPRGTVTFTVEGSDKPVILQVGSSPKEEKDKDKVYVKLSSREGLTLVAKGPIESLINTKPNDLRDKNLIRVESDIVDRINIEPAGKEKLVIARKGESWVRKEDGKDVAINEGAAKRLLSDLQGANVSNFVSDVATDLPKYGLDQPQVKVTLSSFASENTAETKAGEKPIVTLLFGKVDEGNVYVKLDDEPFIVSTPKPILDSILTSSIQWQELAVYKYKASEITALEVSKTGFPPLSLEKDKDKGWKLTKGDGAVNAENVKTLVDTLATLSPVRWVGPAAPDQGLDKPAATIIFTVTQGDKKVPGKITVGAKTVEEQWYATAEGLPGTFFINRPDAEAFQLPLSDKEVELKAKQATPPPAPPTPPGATPAPEAPAAPAPVPVPAPPAPAAAPAPAPATPPAPAPAPAPAAEPAPIPPAPASPTTPAPAPATPPAPAPAAAPAPVPPSPAAPTTPAPAPTTPPAPAPAAEPTPVPPPTPASPTTPAAAPAPAKPVEAPAPAPATPPSTPAPEKPADAPAAPVTPPPTTPAPAPAAPSAPSTEPATPSAPAPQPPAPAPQTPPPPATPAPATSEPAPATPAPPAPNTDGAAKPAPSSP